MLDMSLVTCHTKLGANCNVRVTSNPAAKTGELRSSTSIKCQNQQATEIQKEQITNYFEIN
jgi:hypothetical protein